VRTLVRKASQRKQLSEHPFKTRFETTKTLTTQDHIITVVLLII
jgi:hypothetical protein